ncbi:MAG: nucleotidyltransferase domain-containing protein [Candidatus Aenigmarchaeota archaeon]|nr:nucleotidyltransferase domain-containing protein [Candidatus Aenigmarchaeota archaeon]MDI6722340.1 nucleotidyltransferase domain-containing protein [Candidatus Aenigmarchaeota archaeon]
MLTKKQLDILDAFQENVFRDYTIKEIKALSKEKSNNAMNKAIASFREDFLIEESKVGKNKLYRVNLGNHTVFDYFSIINRQKAGNILLKTLGIVEEEISRFTEFYSIVIFGSYASGRHTKTSDLDIAVFIENDADRKKVEAALASSKNKSVIEIDTHCISKSEFLEMLKAPYENLGKEIARNHRAFYNPAIFYSLLVRGVENGFKI